MPGLGLLLQSLRISSIPGGHKSGMTTAAPQSPRHLFCHETLINRDYPAPKGEGLTDPLSETLTADIALRISMNDQLGDLRPRAVEGLLRLGVSSGIG